MTAPPMQLWNVAHDPHSNFGKPWYRSEVRPPGRRKPAFALDSSASNRCMTDFPRSPTGDSVHPHGEPMLDLIIDVLSAALEAAWASWRPTPKQRVKRGSRSRAAGTCPPNESSSRRCVRKVQRGECTQVCSHRIGLGRQQLPCLNGSASLASARAARF